MPRHPSDGQERRGLEWPRLCAALARVRKGLEKAGAAETQYTGSLARYSGTRITAPQRRHMAAAINARIAHYRRCRPLLCHVTADVLCAGQELFSSEEETVLWLCEPARAFAGVTPISLMRQAKGRARVVDLLHAIAHGVSL